MPQEKHAQAQRLKLEAELESAVASDIAEKTE